jgi:hypothetical protein
MLGDFIEVDLCIGRGGYFNIAFFNNINSFNK